MVVTKFSSCQGYLPFTWHNQTFQLGNQVDRDIPFGKLQKMWVGGDAMFVFFSVCFPFVGVACEQAFRAALVAGRKKEGELATMSLKFDFHLQFPCGSQPTELSYFRQSVRSGNKRECKQTLKNMCQG